jgi:hypothetical protein
MVQSEPMLDVIYMTHNWPRERAENRRDGDKPDASKWMIQSLVLSEGWEFTDEAV